jgi:hypothetical protein
VALSAMSLPADARIAMVIGRLFKLHPDFDIAVANILLRSSERDYVVFVTEKIANWCVFC